MRYQFTPNKVEVKGDTAALIVTRKNQDVIKALVDIEDLGRVLEAGRWTADPNGYILSNHSRISLHRLVVNAPDGLVVDHINHNPADCRKGNLRVTTHAGNMQNRKGAHVTSKSGIRGVYWHKGRGKWVVQVSANGVRHNLGGYDDLAEASKIAKEARERLHIY